MTEHAEHWADVAQAAGLPPRHFGDLEASLLEKVW